jgi:AAA domain
MNDRPDWAATISKEEWDELRSESKHRAIDVNARVARIASDREAKNKRPPPNGEATPFTRKVKRGGDFLKEYVPLIYAFDGLLPSGSLYGVTAKRSGGKTAFLQATALSTITGKDLIGFVPEPGRVAYIVLENPTDFRMKLAVNAYIHGADHAMLNDNLAVLDMRLPHAEIMAQLRADAEEYGPLRLVCYDTFQAGFEGAQFNDNAEVLKHAQQLRMFTELPGNPAAFVACHPIKNASKDNLEPYGGGATMNEFDGNVTFWNEGGVIELSHNKVRGPEFETRFFRIEMLGSPEILDSKGRCPLLPVIRPMSLDSAEQKAKIAGDMNMALLRIILSEPNGTQRQWAMALNKGVGAVTRTLDKLKSQKLVEDLAGKWRVTAKGKRAILAGTNSEDEGE